MKLRIAGAAALLASQVSAGGLDTTGQSISFLFSPGTVAELGFGQISSNVTGNDAAFLGGSPTGNVVGDVSLPFASFKHDFNEKLSFGILVEKPFAASLEYAPTSIGFGGTMAEASTTSVTALVRFKLNDRFSVFAGPRWQSANADFGLTGSIYGPLSGYAASMAQDTSVGYAAGVAFEIPEYFLRVSLTYNSEIEHTFTTIETSPISAPTTTPVSATIPKSLNFEFISGVAPKTFVFGGARWVEWSKLQFAPPVLSSFTPNPLVDFNDTVTYSLGIGRQVSDHWTLTAALIHEPSTDRLTTPLTPSDGFSALSLGAIYSKDSWDFQANVTFSQLGDATPFVASPISGTVSSFSGNTSVAAGMKIVKRF